jgi:hypothetical protein
MRRAVVALLFCLGCDRPAPGARVVTNSSTVSTSKAPVTYALEDTTIPPYAIVSEDSAFGAWGVNGPAMSPSEFYIGSHVRHPSGLMVIWFDTAVRATEDHPVGHVHTDSVVVNDVRHLEYLGVFCSVGASMTPHPRIVGLVPAGDSMFPPRLAWRFNEKTLRIEQIPVDSTVCRVTDPLEGEVD